MQFEGDVSRLEELSDRDGAHEYGMLLEMQTLI